MQIFTGKFRELKVQSPVLLILGAGGHGITGESFSRQKRAENGKTGTAVKKKTSLRQRQGEFFEAEGV